jgi:hypothetical protein
MKYKILSLRPFLGSKNFEQSSNFYREMGFEEIKLWEGFSVFTRQGFSFYLQHAYIKEWIENTQIFFETEDLENFLIELSALNLPEKFPGVRVSGLSHQSWGSECFVHDPSGNLLHFGHFKQ